MNTRRALLRTAGLLIMPVTGGVLTACVGNASTSPTWWELDSSADPGRAAPDPARARLSLAVEAQAAGALNDGTALVFSRQPGMRAVYQYANWSERPAPRIARIVQRKLQQRGGFRDVTFADSGVVPDLLLSLRLEQLYHDVPADAVRLELVASLLDWGQRHRIAVRTFMSTARTPSSDAAGAAAASGAAVDRVLAELMSWVEEQAAGARRRNR